VREPLQQSRDDAYERPNQPWVCGLSAEGSPCPMGPGRRGRCPSATACHPVLEGDRWRCNRSALRGGVCEEGPTPDGECCHLYQCTPLRSLRSWRARFVVGCALAMLGALCIALSANWRNKILSPGPLAVQHAQLLERNGETVGCAGCHAAGDQSLGEWLWHVADDRLAEPSQTELCMECHAKQIPRAWATAAHNVDPARLLPTEGSDDFAAPRRVDPHQALACATCHREHHGAEHDLTWMNDRACQACHREQIDSFTTDHPEFVDWPVKRRTRIAFDHAAHEAKHFPKEKQTFDCATCHQQGPEGDFQQTLGYNAACANCHDRDIGASWEAGVALFALPMLDVQALDEAGHRVGPWPEQASDEFDGALPPITKLLLASDPLGAKSLAKLGVNFDFFDIDVEDAEQMQAAADAVEATKSLYRGVLENGHTEVRRRVEVLLGREISTEELAPLVAHLPPEILSGFLKGRGETVSEGDARSAARQRVEGGGWFRDDLTLSIRYRATGHADRWATAWIEVLAEASSGPHAAIARPLLKKIMKPTAAGLCGQCHSVDSVADGEVEVHWLAKRADEVRSEWTRFSHRPHLVQSPVSPAAGADCRACHAIDAEAQVMASYLKDLPNDFQSGFTPMTRQDCAECHTPQAAGDSCLQCHKYHVE